MWIDTKQWTDDWEELEKLTSGGQAAAKKIKSKKNGQVAFLKILSRQDSHERRARFFREASAYSACSHPNMPRLLESNAHQHQLNGYKLFMATELVAGPTLEKYIESTGPMDFEDALHCVDQLLDVVEYCHGEDWVHRDIKHDNIILKDGDVKNPILVDFGLSFKAEITADFQTEQTQEIGNRFLRLSEFMVGSPLKRDARSDLAGIGGILFYILTKTISGSNWDGEARFPHQRNGVAENLRVISKSSFLPLLNFFDRNCPANSC